MSFIKLGKVPKLEKDARADESESETVFARVIAIANELERMLFSMPGSFSRLFSIKEQRYARSRTSCS